MSDLEIVLFALRFLNSNLEDLQLDGIATELSEDVITEIHDKIERAGKVG